MIGGRTIAETCGDVRRRNRKLLKILAETYCGNVAETPETHSQAIEIIAETETETFYPPTEGVRVGAHARAYVCAHTRVARTVPTGEN